MTEPEKIQRAVQAYRDYQRLVEQLTAEQKQMLDTTIAKVELTKINRIRQTIAQS